MAPRRIRAVLCCIVTGVAPVVAAPTPTFKTAAVEAARDVVHDVVFIISSSGRIEHTVTGGKIKYGHCLIGNTYLPERVSPPPQAAVNPPVG